MVNKTVYTEEHLVQMLTWMNDPEVFVERFNLDTDYAFVVHTMLFDQYKTIAIVGSGLKRALKILEIVKEQYNLIPEWCRPKTTIFNKREFGTDNGNRILTGGASGCVLRGTSVNIMLLDTKVLDMTNHDDREFAYESLVFARDVLKTNVINVHLNRLES